MFKKYISKPVIKEAIKLTRNHAEQVVDFIGESNIKGYNLGDFSEDSCYIDIMTMEGIITASEGDYIIKELDGEFYLCKSDIFENSYEEIKE